MSDSHIHYGTASNPNPYEKDADPSLERDLQRLHGEIMDSVTIDCHSLPSIILEHSDEVLQEMWDVLTDSGDDKLGRLNDIVWREANLHADFKLEQYKIEKGL